MPTKSVLLPQPKSMVETDGSFSISSECRISLVPGAKPELREIAAVFAEDLAAAGVQSEIDETDATAGAVFLSIGSAPEGVPSDVAAQGYSLEVMPEGVKLVGWGEPGLYFGTRTLLQLLEGKSIPACRVEDWPDYRCRMVHYDLAREQTCNLPYLKGVVDRLSAFKINAISLYFETRFQFEKHPAVSPPGVMGAAEAKELDEYARRRHIELVPQLNCLGHMEQALAVPEYRHLAENPEVPYVICPLHPATPDFLDDLIEEMSAAFSSEFFHIGGDEADQLGECPKCAEWIRKRSRSELFAMHFNRVHEMVKKHGKKTMMWGDMLLAHPETADALPKEIVIFDWHYDETTVDTVRFFTERGFPVFACPAMSGFSRTAAPFTHAQSNIWKFIGEGNIGGAVGECTCAWELRLGHFFDNDYFGIILSADRSWNLAACRIDDFNRRFCKVFYGMDDLRAVEYFEAVSDGFMEAKTGLPHHIARNSWEAFGDVEKSVSELGSQITGEMYSKCLELQHGCLVLLVGMLREATRNRETLAFADVPAHTSMLLVKKSYLYMKASELVRDGKREQAVACLQELLRELDYFKARFEEAVRIRGSSQLDPERVARLSQAVSARLAQITP